MEPETIEKVFGRKVKKNGTMSNLTHYDRDFKMTTFGKHVDNGLRKRKNVSVGPCK